MQKKVDEQNRLNERLQEELVEVREQYERACLLSDSEDDDEPPHRAHSRPMVEIPESAGEDTQDELPPINKKNSIISDGDYSAPVDSGKGHSVSQFNKSEHGAAASEIQSSAPAVGAVPSQPLSASGELKS